MASINERVNYYLGNLKDINNLFIKHDLVQTSNSHFPANKLVSISLLDLYLICIKQNDNFQMYGPIITNIINRNPYLWKYRFKNILFRWGDCIISPKNDDLFYITKARKCDSNNGVIMKMSIWAHWKKVSDVKQFDIPFENKKNILLWRGATTGGVFEERGVTREGAFENNRLLAVNTMIDSKQCNVGFSFVCQDKNPDRRLVKNLMSLKELLEYKYLLSLEGNDVASGLKWQLYSNSVVFMRKPRVVSWAMEDTLVPFVHYIPLLDDFSDFKEKIEWANNNQDKCKEISANATTFIEQFLDEKKEREIERLVLENYLSRITINVN